MSLRCFPRLVAQHWIRVDLSTGNTPIASRDSVTDEQVTRRR